MRRTHTVIRGLLIASDFMFLKIPHIRISIGSIDKVRIKQIKYIPYCHTSFQRLILKLSIIIMEGRNLISIEVSGLSPGHKIPQIQSDPSRMNISLISGCGHFLLSLVNKLIAFEHSWGLWDSNWRHQDQFFDFAFILEGVM